jgi:transposase
MASRFEVDDELWAEIAPLIPVRQRRRRYPVGCPALTVAR